MTKILNRYLIVAALVFVAPLKALTQEQPLTFDEALSMTLQNNYLLKQSKHKTAQMEQEMRSVKGIRRPHISLSASYTLLSDRIHLDLTPVRDAITPLYETLGKYGQFSGVPNPDPNTNGVMPVLPDNISTQVVREKLLEGLETVQKGEWDKTIQERQFGIVNAAFVWPIFTGGKINAANRAARIRFEEAQIEDVQKAHELTSELVERYFGLLLARQARLVREEVKSTMANHFNDAQKMEEQGMIPSVETLNARLQLADAERELQKAIRQSEIINDALNNTLATDSALKILPVTQLFYLENIESVDYFYQQALVKSPLLKQVDKKKELAGEGLKAERSGHLPTIAATGLYDIVDKDFSPYLPNYMVGVGIKWNVFEGLSQSKKIKAAQLQQAQADDFYHKASADIRTAISKYYQELNMYLEQLNMLDASMKLATEYYRVRQKAFAEGMATSTQVSEASLALAKARIDRLQAMYGYDTALAKLLYYSGITDEFSAYMARSEARRETYIVPESQQSVN